MGKLFSLVVAAGLVMSSPAFAADNSATLRVDSGRVMVSTGGEFTAVNGNSPFVAGNRMMLAEGAAATVFYDEGCTRSYTEPGVYPYDPNCSTGGAPASDNMVDWTRVSGVVLGVVAVAAATGALGGGDDPQPVSR